MADVVSAPARLRFRLIGTWHPILLNDLSSSDLIKDFVRDVVGNRDQDATVRERLRRQFNEIIEQAVDGRAEAMFVVTEVGGAQIFATLTVRGVDDVRLSPAVGESPAEVMRVLIESLESLERAGMDTAAVIDMGPSQALRLHRVREEEYDEGGEKFTSRTLNVDYWYTVPGTKELLLVNFITPMGDIPNVMMAFFDSVVRASYFDEAPDPQPQTSAESRR